MKGGKIEKILTAKAQKVAKQCALVAPRFADETIHQFRVEVKRLRSFLRLLNTITDIAPIKFPKKFKVLYDIAGKIREAQLEIDMINKKKLQFPAYRQHLHNSIAYQAKEWEAHYSERVVKGLVTKITASLPPDLLHDTLIIFFDLSLKEISTILTTDPDNEQIHTYRKKVKDMLYVAKIAEKEWGSGIKRLGKFPLKELDHLSDLLGTYNDERIMLDKLLRFSSHTIPQNENQLLYRYCKTALKEQELNKKKVVEAVKNFVRHAQTAL